jgi:hypothetical protein
LSADQREYRRRQFAQTPLGAATGAMIAPLSAVTGGLIPPLVPQTPTLQQLLDKGPVGAAAKVKVDALNAKKRKEAVEELEDVDCHYWPEVEDALIAALRADRNESVRYTAAKTLGSGKCCTKKTIEALSICASGSDRDGAPCEVSKSVRTAAAKALEKCLECPCLNRCGVQACEEGEPVSPEERPREEPPRVPGDGVLPAAALIPLAVLEEDSDLVWRRHLREYYGKLRNRPTAVIVARAREVLANGPAPLASDPPLAANGPLLVGNWLPDPRTGGAAALPPTGGNPFPETEEPPLARRDAPVVSHPQVVAPAGHRQNESAVERRSASVQQSGPPNPAPALAVGADNAPKTRIVYGSRRAARGRYPAGVGEPHLLRALGVRPPPVSDYRRRMIQGAEFGVGGDGAGARAAKTR